MNPSRRAVLLSACTILLAACGPDDGPSTQSGAVSGAASGNGGAAGQSVGVGPGGADAPGAGGSGGRAPSTSCLPADAHGDLVTEDAILGTRVYGACVEGQILIERLGKTPFLTQEELSAFKESISDALLAVPGVVGHRTELCCPDSDAFCIVLTLQTHTTTVEELPAKLAAIVGDELCVPFLVEKLGFEEPRCQKDDPTCVPFPMCPTATDPMCCPAAVAYDPAEPRVPDTKYTFLSEGARTYDGECVPNGCGSHCNAYTVPGMLAVCGCYPELAPALCGCVDGTCTWFFQ